MGSGEAISIKRKERDFPKTEKLTANTHAHTEFKLRKTEAG